MDFSVIIVSWNVKEQLAANLKSLLASAGASLEIIVVDNSSSDGSIEMLQNDFPDLRLIANNENLGFSRACNQGLKNVSGDTVVLLNPDMHVQSDTFANLKQWLRENPQADVCGIRLVDEKGSIVPQVRRFPSFKDQLAIVLKLPHLFPRILDSYLRQDFDYTSPAKVDSVRGAFFAIRRTAFERFGMLDERYFIWFEEVDYCRQVKEKGGQVWYTPAATATDFIGQSFDQVGRSLKQKYFRDSMLAYFKKWQPSWQLTLLRLAWMLARVFLVLGSLFKLRSRART